MRVSLSRIFLFAFVLLASFVFLSSNASAQIAPFLMTDGNYTYTDLGDGTGSLTFSSVNPTWATYTNGESGCNWDPIYGGCDHQDDIIGNNWAYSSEFSFGTLTNSTGSPTMFGSANLSVYEIGNPGSVFFSATIDNFDTSLTWMSLSNVVAGSAPSSRYVTELLANGNGSGNIQISFTPSVGTTEDFIGSSSGSIGMTVAAPEPISAILFVTGGATLALRRYRKKRI